MEERAKELMSMTREELFTILLDMVYATDIGDRAFRATECRKPVCETNLWRLNMRSAAVVILLLEHAQGHFPWETDEVEEEKIARWYTTDRGPKCKTKS